MPGESFTYDFTIQDPPGMYVYHSHFNSAEQVGDGLYGPLIVAPKALEVRLRDRARRRDVDDPRGRRSRIQHQRQGVRDLPIIAERGQWVLIHMANDGELLHPMHLHGFHFEVVGRGRVPAHDVEPVHGRHARASRRDRGSICSCTPNSPGIWAFHCHILNHVEGPKGMFGMVTALIVEQALGSRRVAQMAGRQAVNSRSTVVPRRALLSSWCRRYRGRELEVGESRSWAAWTRRSCAVVVDLQHAADLVRRVDQGHGQVVARRGGRRWTRLAHELDHVVSRATRGRVREPLDDRRPS